MSDESPDEFLAAHRARKRLTMLAATLVALVIGGGVVAFIATRKPTPKRPPPDAEVSPLTAADLDRAYTEHRRQEAMSGISKACDAEVANHELKLLGNDDDWEGIVIVGDAYLGRCPADEQVRWKLFRALEELERWPDAEAEATRMLAMNATDVDYWWWRGKARKHTGDVVGSAADYRQSIALTEDMSSSRGINIMGYVDVAPTVGRACEAAFAMRWWGHRNGGAINGDAVSTLRSLSDFGNCPASVGTGQAILTVDTPKDFAINGATLSGVVDLHAPYVVLSSADAAKASLDLSSAQPIELVLDGAITPAQLLRTTVTLGELTAPDVEVAVVDALSPARLGLGLLWRFDYAPSDDGTTAARSPRSPTPAPSDSGTVL